MMLATLEAQPTAEKAKPETAKGIAEIRKYKSRPRKRAEILDIQESLKKRLEKCNGNNQEFVTLVRAWTELETLLQALDAAKVKGAGALPKSVAKSLASVAEDDPSAESPATDLKV